MKPILIISSWYYQSFKEELHFKSKLSMFWALSQKYQNFAENVYNISIVKPIVWEEKIKIQ